MGGWMEEWMADREAIGLGFVVSPLPACIVVVVYQAPNGFQTGASVTMEFSREGETRRLASSSAKSSSLAVSSQQNSADIAVVSKPTLGSAAGGGPILLGVSTARLCNLSLGRGSIML
ncbi:hypothetical protein Q8A73_017107 [Channa argus]|nr:hypothetical protein Q8A73_017107 [Channa argus]